MRRGDVVLVEWIHSDLTIGKRRPAIVIQANFLSALIANTVLIQVTKTVRNSPTEIVIDPAKEPASGLHFVSTASCHNFLTVHQARIAKTLGHLSAQFMQEIDARVKVALELPYPDYRIGKPPAEHPRCPYNEAFVACLLPRRNCGRMDQNVSKLVGRPAAWKVGAAFAVLYLSWGTTFFAIREGVHTYALPPALFGGVRVSMAGFVLLGYLRLRGEPLRMPRRELFWVILAGLFLFVGGNGLLNAAMDTVPSGVGSVLGATTPLWMALLETLWPWGERLTLRGWIGLVVGMSGVLFLMAPKLQLAESFLPDYGHLLLMGSSVTWALGSLIVRYRQRSGSHLTAASYQMIAGGSALALIGLALGEAGQLTPDKLVPGAAIDFVYLLVVGSLMGFVTFNWLLGHVPAAMVGTYAYVNPLVAVLVGRVLGGEELSRGILGAMIVILGGVALVRGAGVRPPRGIESKELAVVGVPIASPDDSRDDLVANQSP